MSANTETLQYDVLSSWKTNFFRNTNANDNVVHRIAVNGTFSVSLLENALDLDEHIHSNKRINVYTLPFKRRSFPWLE